MSHTGRLSFCSLSFMPAHLVLQGLNKYLVLNPDVHLLPAPSLAHLAVLYAVSYLHSHNHGRYCDADDIL